MPGIPRLITSNRRSGYSSASSRPSRATKVSWVSTPQPKVLESPRATMRKVPGSFSISQSSPRKPHRFEVTSKDRPRSSSISL